MRKCSENAARLVQSVARGTALTGALLAGVALCGMPAQAQQVRSADQIIKDLQPTASMLSGPTRGIRPVGPAAPAPAENVAKASASAPVRAPSASAVTRASVSVASPAVPSSNLTVQFKSGSADLTPQAVQALDELGAALSSPTLAGFRFRIEGHTDTVGSRESNLLLSDRRAKVVADYLTSKFGVNASRVEPVGMGEDNPVVPTPPQTSEPRNRRVQIVNLGS